MLVSQNNTTAAKLVFQTNPVGLCKRFLSFQICIASFLMEIYRVIITTSTVVFTSMKSIVIKTYHFRLLAMVQQNTFSILGNIDCNRMNVPCNDEISYVSYLAKPKSGVPVKY